MKLRLPDTRSVTDWIRTRVFRGHARSFNFAMFAGALGIIAAAELALPSIPLTGLQRPEPTPAPRYIGEVPITKERFKYGALTAQNVWLRDLRPLNRDEMLQGLDAEIARVAEKQAELDATVGGAATFPFEFTYRQTARLSALKEGLLAARADLDSFWDADRKIAREANQFVAQRLRTAAGARKEQADRDWSNARAARDAYVNGLPEGADTSDDPEYAKLTQAVNLTSSLSIDASILLSNVQRLQSSQPKLPRPQDPFPQFTAPLPLLEIATAAQGLQQSADQQMQDAVATGALISHGGMDALRALRAAVTGYERASQLQFDHLRCSLTFHSDRDRIQPVPVCEVAIALPINYDLTGQNCARQGLPVGMAADLVRPGTRITEDLCKESWIFPHLNMVFTSDRVTVYPPLPSGMSSLEGAMPPLSLWTLTWAGTDYVLDRPRDLTWQGPLNALFEQDMSLTHGVRPDIGTPRIWRDIAVSWPGRNVTAAVTAQVGAEHAFAPQTYSIAIPSNLAAAGVPFVTLSAQPVHEGGAPSLGRVLLSGLDRYSRQVMSHAEQSLSGVSTGAIAQAANPCGFPLTYTGGRRNAVNFVSDAQQEFAIGLTCERLLAYQSLTRSVLRSIASTSWLDTPEIGVFLTSFSPVF